MKCLDAGATFSTCGRYRYRLWRLWDETRPLRALFCGLNPSTANGRDDDPSVRKMAGFADRWGCGGFDLVNMAAVCETSPDRMVAIVRAHGLTSAVGPENDVWIEKAVRDAIESGSPIVLAWGANASRRELRPRADQVRRDIARLCSTTRHPIECLGRAADGSPRHPLMLAYATPRVPA